MEESKYIYYKEGYKYQTTEPAYFNTGIAGYSIETQFIILYFSGIMEIKRGYAWDGPSGPTFDTPDSMRASLPHDALYQFMRMGLIPQSCRPKADELLHRLLLEDGMSELRADIWYEGVKEFAPFAADPKNIKRTIKAP